MCTASWPASVTSSRGWALLLLVVVAVVVVGVEAR
jgi:hypothetical protein